ncbi:hypothetical protein RJZ90_002520 [Blastomyces dermatitidis]
MARFDPTVWSSAPTPKPRQDDEPQTSRRAKKRPFRTTNHNATASHPNTGRIHPNTGPSYRRDGAFKLGPVGGCGLGRCSSTSVRGRRCGTTDFSSDASQSTAGGECFFPATVVGGGRAGPSAALDPAYPILTEATWREELLHIYLDKEPLLQQSMKHRLLRTAVESRLFALELPCLGDVRCSSIVYDLLRLDPFQKAGFVTLDTFKVLNALRLLIRNHFSFEISGPV